jgi:hypothetical protein
MLRVRASLFVLTPGVGHELQLGLRLMVPLPLHGQPIVHPWLNHRHDCAGMQSSCSVPLVQVQV